MDGTEFIPVITDGKIADETGKIYDLTKTVDGSVVAYLTAGIIVTLMAVILIEIRAIKKNGGKFMPFIIGIMAYVFFGVLIYGIFAIFVNSVPGMSQFAIDHEIQRLLFVMALTAVLIVFGKVFAIYTIKDSYGSVGDALSFGAGFALGNAGSIIINWFMTSTIVNAINNAGGLIGLFKNAEPEAMLEYAKQYEILFTLEGNEIMYQGLFVVLMVAFNTFTVAFIYAISRQKMSFYVNWIICAIHFVLLFVNALGTYGYIDHMLAFIICALIVIASLRYIFMTAKFKLDDMLKPVTDKTVYDKSKYKPKMMKASKTKKYNKK